MNRIGFFSVVFCAIVILLLLSGCGKRYVPPQPLTGEDHLRLAKLTLQQYIDGETMGSEIESFDEIVTQVRTVDPTKAEILKRGFEELKRTPPNALKPVAKKILDQL
ncbi:MAG: hypothetical protein LBC02_12675 [Planctomycetaceae bacterium]|jgi:hypothetical protein|nr:hypothetical protein [Planctomycetaceae bacterium]